MIQILLLSKSQMSLIILQHLVMHYNHHLLEHIILLYLKNLYLEEYWFGNLVNLKKHLLLLVLTIKLVIE